jgi:hypothetical protein
MLACSLGLWNYRPHPELELVERHHIAVSPSNE